MFSSCLSTFNWCITFYYFIWLRTTCEGSVPEMRIWFILLMKSDFKWCTCIHLSKIFFSCFNYLISVTAGGEVSAPRQMTPCSTVDCGWFIAFWEHKNFVGLLHPCVWLRLLIWYFWGITFQLCNYFGEGSLKMVQHPTCEYGPLLLLKSNLKLVIYLSRSLFFI